MYIGIGYILVLDIFCQQLGDIFLYWIYSANNWQIYSGIGYILPTIGRYFMVLNIFCQQLGDICQLWGVGAGLQIVHLLECVFSLKSIFCNPTRFN